MGPLLRFLPQQAGQLSAFADAFRCVTPTGGSGHPDPTLVNNRLGAIGTDASNEGNSGPNSDWRIMAWQGGAMCPNQALGALLIGQPLSCRRGAFICRNFGERLPFGGGGWFYSSLAGLPALDLGYSRVLTERAHRDFARPLPDPCALVLLAPR